MENYGWSNHETYIANLYISNTETVWLVLRNASADHIKEVIIHGVGLQPARNAIGDLDKVNWQELAAHLNDSTCTCGVGEDPGPRHDFKCPIYTRF